MRPLIILVVFLTIGCNSHTEQPEKIINGDDTQSTTTKLKSGNSQYYTSKDTLLIATETGDTLKFSKEEFNQIVDKHPEFYGEFAYNPDFLYHQYGNSVDFGSEQGQDVYYALYAYFLKQKNGIVKFADQRKRLIGI